MSRVTTQSPDGKNKLDIIGSDHFVDWMEAQKISLALTTYQSGKLFFIGHNREHQFSIYERTFDRCMGLWANAQTLYMSTCYQFWRFENALKEGQMAQGYDRLYVPQVGHITGDLDIHDIVVDNKGGVVFVNTLFSCLATLDDKHSFTPIWHPPFISKLAAEDRCHLNGLTLRDGIPRYVTAVSQADGYEGWRDARTDGGIVMDISNNNIIADGLSMPHSPRWYHDKLWLLNSGTGYLGYIEFTDTKQKKGKFIPVTFCPGYARGLCFSGDYAIIGLSKRRGSKTFTGLTLDDNLDETKQEDRCGLVVVDLNTGEIVHTLTFEGIVCELYDVVTLQDVQRPMALGLRNKEICQLISLE